MGSLAKLENHSPSVDLKYYALSFQDKQREAKRKEKEFQNAIAVREILKIKKTPWIAFTDNNGVIDEIKIDGTEGGFVNHYFVDLLNFNHLLALQGIRFRSVQLLRLLLSSGPADESNTKVHSLNGKSSAFSNVISILGNIPLCFKNLTRIFHRRCIHFIYRAIGLYYCFKLNNQVQRLIVPLKDVTLLKKIKKSDFRIVYFLEKPSSYHILLFMYLFYWNNIETPAVFLRAEDTPWICRALRNLGVIVIDSKALNSEDGVMDVKKLQTQIEEVFKSKKAITFCSPTFCPSEAVGDLVRAMTKIVSCNSVISDTMFATVNFSSEDIYPNMIENWLLLNERNTKSIRNFLKHDFGIVQAKIGVPFSLKKIIASSHVTLYPESSSTRTDLVTKNVKTRLDFEFSNSQVLMSTHLVSFVLLYKFRDGVKFNDLVKAVDLLRSELTYRKKSLGFSGTSENVVKHAIKLLATKLDVIETNSEYLIKPVLRLPDVIHLSRLSTVALNYFALDAAIMTCLQVQFKSQLEDAFKSHRNALTFHYNDFAKKIEQLCEILQTEFSFEGPNQRLSTEISNALFKYIELECFVKDEKFLTDEERWGHRFAKHLESDDEDDSYYNPSRGDVYSVNFNGDTDLYQKIKFLQKSLQPIIDTYAVIFDNLRTFVKKPTIHQELVKQIFLKLKSLLDENCLEYPESVSLELVIKCIELLERSNILKSYAVDAIKIYYLNEEDDGSTNLANMEYKLKYFKQ